MTTKSRVASIFAGWLLLVALVVVGPGDMCVGWAAQPNIVLILADDFGVGDIQAHYPENKLATPLLARLASQCIRFTDAHSPSAVCSPTRYGILTGRYAWRTRLQEWVIASYEPPLIDSQRPTLPGYLAARGYRTACIGKWHLGWNWPGPQPSQMTAVRNGQKFFKCQFNENIADGPTTHGFDYYFGDDVPNLPPYTFIENDRVVVQPTESFKVDPNEGIVLPKSFEGSPMAPGWRLADVLPTLTRRAGELVEDWASDDQPFFLYFSLPSPHEPVVPSGSFRGKSGIAPIADFVMQTDWAVGQVMNAVSKAGVADNTLIIFTADNGHSHYTGWDELVAAGHFPSGPYRGHKGDIWEGGHRVPLVMSWPGQIAPGTASDRLVSLTDFFATCADIVGEELPARAAEDSISFLPAVRGTSSHAGRTSLVHHSNHGEFAYREGPWKLVFRRHEANLDRSRGKPTVAELYNLAHDIAETENVASLHPDVADRLRGRLTTVIEQGASRADCVGQNDTLVRFDTIQNERWAPAAN